MSDNHGRVRAGAGRKPKALLYADMAACAEQKIADALPSIVDALIESAKGGDLGAARYLCDRILGRVAAVSVAPAEDRALPMTERDCERLIRCSESTAIDILLADMACP